MTEDDYKEVTDALEAVMRDAQTLIERMELEGRTQQLNDDYRYLHALHEQAARQYAHYREETAASTLTADACH